MHQKSKKFIRVRLVAGLAVISIIVQFCNLLRFGDRFNDTGALAIAVANPTDLVKVRLQAEGNLLPGLPRRYSGALNAYYTIMKQEGLAGLWTGIGPNIARNAIINAAELASYDQVKETILKIPGFTDSVFTHLLAGLGAGFFAVCIGSPVDVVKSRMMGDSIYKSTLDCFIRTLKTEAKKFFVTAV